MTKALLKNILIVLFLTIAVFSIIKYKTILDEKRELLNTLNQTKQQALTLEKEKQNLLQGIEKRKKIERELDVQALRLKDNLKASITRITKLFARNNAMQREFDNLSSQFSSLKTENTVLKGQEEQVAMENESLKAKLSSIEELKKAIQELKKNKSKAGKIQGGNSGFLTKGGQFTYPAKVRIDVIPAPKTE